jgi:hypothetical protein
MTGKIMHILQIAQEKAQDNMQDVDFVQLTGYIYGEREVRMICQRMHRRFP